MPSRPGVLPEVEFQVGSRVRVSEEGFDAWAFGDKYRYRIGTIRSRSRDHSCASVTWDGVKQSMSVSKRYLELFSEPVA